MTASQLPDNQRRAMFARLRLGGKIYHAGRRVTQAGLGVGAVTVGRTLVKLGGRRRLPPRLAMTTAALLGTGYGLKRLGAGIVTRAKYVRRYEHWGDVRARPGDVFL